MIINRTAIRRLILSTLMPLLVLATPSMASAQPTGQAQTSPTAVTTYTIDFWNVDDIAFVVMNDIVVFGAGTRDPAPFDLTPQLTGSDDFIRIHLYNTYCYTTSLDITITRTMNGVKRFRSEHFGPEWWGWNCGQVDKVDWTYRVNRNTGLFQRFNWNTGAWENM